MDQLKNFSSHRTPVLTCNGCVSSNQPLATKAGLAVLEQGGNAADAAVAVAAAMAVTEPASTGLGGDAFCLYYNASTRTVHGLNGSGRCPSTLNLTLLASEGFDACKPLPERHVHNVTVPGTAAAWCDTLELFGSNKLTLKEILAPAIELAEKGWPVTPVTAYQWNENEDLLKSQRNGNELLLNGKAPCTGEVMYLHNLAKSLKVLGDEGKEGFYQGSIGQAIVAEVGFLGGVLSMADLIAHTSTVVQPIRVDYKGYSIWEIPPNGLGITTLLALNILEDFDLKSLGLGSAEYLHLLIEALKLSFADSLYYVADPETSSVPTQNLLDKQYAATRRKLISASKANDFPVHGNPDIKRGSDTVYFTVTDKNGNACSFINSVYMEFGTGIVPKDCGFTLHVLLGMVEFGLDPQQALNMPRFTINIQNKTPWNVYLEKEIPENVKDQLVAKGHQVLWPIEGFKRSKFGRGHIITRGAWFNTINSKVCTNNSVWWGAADPRCDGCPLGY